ncbi:unnamed protein product [Rhizophagus irregularis]|nr:unnamed protein product [Rhizophagus irregularis]
MTRKSQSRNNSVEHLPVTVYWFNGIKLAIREDAHHILLNVICIFNWIHFVSWLLFDSGFLLIISFYGFYFIDSFSFFIWFSYFCFTLILFK